MMKKIVLNIDESKFNFFMELIRSLDFVRVDEDDSHEEIIENVKNGLEEVRLARQGKLSTRSAKDFLDEL